MISHETHGLENGTNLNLLEQDIITLMLPWEGNFEKIRYHKNILIYHTKLCSNSLFSLFSLALFHFSTPVLKCSGTYYMHKAISNIELRKRIQEIE